MPETEDDMARAKARPLDEARIAALVQELRLTVDKPAAFKPVFDALAGDVTLTAGDIIEIALRLPVFRLRHLLPRAARFRANV